MSLSITKLRPARVTRKDWERLAQVIRDLEFLLAQIKPSLPPAVQSKVDSRLFELESI
jgi:hypothetical protein